MSIPTNSQESHHVDMLEPNLDGQDLRIAIVQGRFNDEHCAALTKSCLAELQRLKVAPGDILLMSVPGALEIPLALQKLGETGEFDALIALGAVIRGETYHFELVSNESGAGITRVGLDLGLPIANGILTCDTDEQARARVIEKGADCARAAIEMANYCLLIEEGGDE